jgi:hypothetical protein
MTSTAIFLAILIAIALMLRYWAGLHWAIAALASIVTITVIYVAVTVWALMQQEGGFPWS